MQLIFSDDFIERLKQEPIAGLVELCSIVQENLGDDHQEWHDSDYEVLIQGYALIIALVEAKILPITAKRPILQGIINDDCFQLNQFISSVQQHSNAELKKLKLETLRSKFRNTLGAGFCYEFSQGDLNRVQELIDEIRMQITSTKSIQDDHRQRLLRRLEKLQSELHKKVSDLDRFWGLIGDAGVVLGKLGRDAKPIVDRIKEIADIVWQTQARAEELPSGTKPPMLQHGTGESEKSVE